MIRKPSVAGFFYPGHEQSLRTMLEDMVNPDADKQEAICVVSPHAGYRYSGRVAAKVYSAVKLPQRCVLLGPSHRAIQSHFAIMREGSWSTPLGNLPIDTELANLIMSESDLISEDIYAHKEEHSLEVQLPFLQYFNPEISIVPISNTYFASYPDLEQMGKSLAKAIQAIKDDVLIVASTDMSHQVSQETAKEKDFQAIDRILQLDAQGLHQVVNAEQISMCGFQATTAALVAACELGATKAELIEYQTSGDVTGDYHSVVGYAGLLIK